MNSQQANTIVNKALAVAVTKNKAGLAALLTKNGIPAQPYESDSDIITKVLQANHSNSDFSNQLAAEIAKSYGTKSFVQQIDSVNTMNLNSLAMGDINTTEQRPWANADGTDASTSTDVLGLLNGAIGLYTTDQQAAAQKQSASAVLQHDANQILQNQQSIQLANAKASGIGAGFSAFIPVLIVGGVVVIGGLWAYYKFKKK